MITLEIKAKDVLYVMAITLLSVIVLFDRGKIDRLEKELYSVEDKLNNAYVEIYIKKLNRWTEIKDLRVSYKSTYVGDLIDPDLPVNGGEKDK